MTYEMYLQDRERQGEERGRREGFIEALFGLYKDGQISLAVAARKSNLTEEEFLKASESLESKDSNA